MNADRSYAEVVILSNIGRASIEGRSFHYDVPQALRGRVARGHLVIVPLRARRVPGVVVALSDSSPVEETKSIESLLDPIPILSPTQLELARWISESTLAPLNECIDLFVPAGVAARVDTLYALTSEVVPKRIGTTQADVFALLKRRGPLRGAQINRALPRKAWQNAVRSLARRGVIETQPVLLPPRVRPKTARFARALVDPATVDARTFSRQDRVAARRLAILNYLAHAGKPVRLTRLYAELDCSQGDMHLLAERELIALSDEEVWRDSLRDKAFVPTVAPTLTDDQAQVWAPIEKMIEEAGQSSWADEVLESKASSTPILLHGVTGSGKTEIYLRAVDATLQRGGQAIVLVPEIALTPQTVRRFSARFAGRIAVLHSGLSDGERYDMWRRARLGAVDIVIGARSAVFAPLARLGLIVIDEEHEGSYKQANRPYYHAREVALRRARLMGAVVIMGSATPSLEATDRAQRGEFRRLMMPRRILGHVQRVRDQEERYRIKSQFESASGEAFYRELPPVEIVDLRAELRAGNTHMFSRRLQAALKETLTNGEQSILFLNRRGMATFVSCRDCGHVLQCPRCDSPLTYHESAQRSSQKLICHTCNYRETQPERCPNCDSVRIRHFGAGTQKVEAEVRALYPDARVLRWDRDTTRGRSTHHEEILQRFVDGQADVLIGTQMVAKGLDLPLVTLVGVVSADTALNLPDFRSSERTFQLLAQVAGRAGRGLQGGRAIIQTYQPDHYAVVSAADHDYQKFAEKELAFRQEHRYPPFTRLARLLVRAPDAARAREAAESVGLELEAMLARRGIGREAMIGPAPCFFSRIAGQWRWHIVIRDDDPAALLRDFALPQNWRIDIDPLNLL